MNHIANERADGRYDHVCLDCGRGLKEPQTARHVVWICACPGPKTFQGPTVTLDKAPSVKPKKLRNLFKMPRVRCAFLGAAKGDPVKVSCGNTWRQPQECMCNERTAKVSRGGESLDNLAAWDWWCGDLGDAKSDKPAVVKYCGMCPFYREQALLPAPPGLH